MGTWDVTALGIGAIIGGGIFATMSTAAVGEGGRPGAGPSLILSFAVTAALCALPALCYAELASMIRAPGSAYSYARACFGRWVGWLIGWDLILEFTIANVAVAVSWARYMRGFLASLGWQVPLWLACDRAHGRALPEVLAAAPRLGGQLICANLLACSVILVLTLLLAAGTRTSLRVNTWLVVFKVGVLLMFSALVMASWWGSSEGLSSRWTPFFAGGLEGTLSGAAVVFFSFIGFDSVSCLSAEARRPARTIPRGILASLGVCALIYCLTAAAFTGAMNLAPASGAGAGASATGQATFVAVLQRAAPWAPWAPWVLSVGALVAQTTALLAFQVAQARIFVAMAQDGLLPRALAGRPGRPPVLATWAAGIGVGGLAAFCDMDEMIALSNVGTLFAFAMVCLGVVVLRLRRPSAERAFRVPGPAWGLPLLGLAACVLLMVFLPPSSWWRFLAWLGLGGVIGGLLMLQQWRRRPPAARKPTMWALLR